MVIPAVLDKLDVVKSFADIVTPVIEIPDPAIKASCFALKISYSVLLNNPAVVPLTDANGMVNAIAGFELAFVTVEVNVLPLAVTVIGFTLVTVPPLPVAETVIEPSPLVIVTPLPAVMVVLDKVPLVVPINICPFE